MDGRQIAAGVAGGIAGGIAFGVLMHAQGMIGMIAGLVGGDGVVLGWGVHLIIAALIGLGFALTLGRLATSWGAGGGLGLLYGGIWWVLGPLLIMPAWMGMPLFQVDEMALMSLGGHLVYGLILGLVFVAATGELSSVRREQGHTVSK
jgi:hypothetical protein